jgi:ABC-type dipeptide/oligopeptide/nickel transport system permease subunit
VTAFAAARRRGWRPSIQLELVLGAGLGILLLFGVIVGPFLLGQDPNAIDIGNRFAPPSAEHLLGTDDLGRDLATRLALGGRATLLIALAATAVSTVIAIVLGVLTGFARGPIDTVVTRVVDLFFAIPNLLVAIGIVGILGASLQTTVIALGLAYWPYYTRLIRSAVVEITSRPYLDAARVLGARPWYMIVREVTPGLIPLLLVQFTVTVGWAVLDEAGLGFLGLGVQPPEASWGSILAQSREFMLSYPQIGVIAGVPILMTVLSINLLADALRARLDPKGETR